mgnify:CR=1 FL=1
MGIQKLSNLSSNILGSCYINVCDIMTERIYSKSDQLIYENTHPNFDTLKVRLLTINKSEYVVDSVRRGTISLIYYDEFKY